ncbi:7-cyano-7-deazaguanine synthase [Frankia sp. Mgl5]|uniref:7-cyano-7-deazaguanine synthase n=1 Tax=Frankia sp. Mgl5 TaxID=2933793 RepID=UPI00200FE7DE|nr:7-cyano-7-deazaguanine synthase [Frankia sp. Mgl5]MCK9928835.1 7-cyano-7-deazaguanine synthase [Frankia sp. Mgl5]
MASYSMCFQIPESVSPAEARGCFFWVHDSTRDSFVSTLLPQREALGPRLGALGPVAEANVDLVRLAVMVYAADRSTLRRVGSTNWSRRDLSLDVPVAIPSRWEPVRLQLQSLLGFLSGDTWTLTFCKAAAPKEKVQDNRFAGAKRVVLLSGGADSAVGALLSRHELGDAPQVLMSHVGLTNLRPVQQNIAQRIGELIDGPTQFHQQIHFSRHATQYEGTRFPDETSTRTRSFLFLALGLAIASMDGVPLWIPENGFASLNLPLTADQRGSLSTRTTHPMFLEQLAALASAAGAHAQIENPLSGMTKGEMFRNVGELVGNEAASGLLSATHSCGHTGHRNFKISPIQHCGVCFGCLLRRASFLASGLEDRTSYLSARIAGRPDNYLRSKSMEPSLRSFLARGLRNHDFASLTLPTTYPTAAARDICKRALVELGLLFL